MFWYNIISSPTFPIDKKILKNILIYIDTILDKTQNWILNIVFLSSIEIQNLNRQYRQLDKSTDVLSFHYFDDFSALNSDEIAWELIFCEDKILTQAKEYWLWDEKEFYKLFIHSVLHILWYDHEEDWEYKVMQSLEDEIWEYIFNS